MPSTSVKRIGTHRLPRAVPAIVPRARDRAGRRWLTTFLLVTALAPGLGGWVPQASAVPGDPPGDSFLPYADMQVTDVEPEDGYGTAGTAPQIALEFGMRRGDDLLNPGIKNMQFVMPAAESRELMWRVNGEGRPDFCDNRAFLDSILPDISGCPEDSLVGDVTARIGIHAERVDRALVVTLRGHAVMSCGGGSMNRALMYVVLEEAQAINPRTGEPFALKAPAISMAMMTRRQDERITIDSPVAKQEVENIVNGAYDPVLNPEGCAAPADDGVVAPDFPVDLSRLEEALVGTDGELPRYLTAALQSMTITLHGGTTRGLMKTPPNNRACTDTQSLDSRIAGYANVTDPDATERAVDLRVPVKDTQLETPGVLSGCPVSLPFETNAEVSSSTFQAADNPLVSFHATRSDHSAYLSGMKLTLQRYMLGDVTGAPGICHLDQAARDACPGSALIGQGKFGVTVFDTWPDIYPEARIYMTDTQPGDIATGVMVAAAPSIANDEILNLVVHLSAQPNAEGIVATVNPGSIPAAFHVFDVINEFDGRTGGPNHNLLFNAYTCDPSSMQVEFTSELGQVATHNVPYTSTGCDALPYEQSLAVEATCKTTHCKTGIESTLTAPAKGATTRIAEFSIPNTFSTVLDSPITPCSPAAAAVGSCPEASRIGTLALETPLVQHEITGPIYFGQGDGDVIARVYARIKDIVELTVEGKLVSSPDGGFLARLESPPMPITRLRVSFEGGDRALVYTPTTCGPHRFQYRLTSHTGREIRGGNTVEIDCPPPRLRVSVDPARAGARTALTASIRPNPGASPIREATLDLGRGSQRFVARAAKARAGRGLGALTLIDTKGQKATAAMVGLGKGRLGGKLRKRGGRSARALAKVRVVLKRGKLLISRLPNVGGSRELILKLDGRNGLLRNGRPGKVRIGGTFKHFDGSATAAAAIVRVKR